MGYKDYPVDEYQHQVLEIYPHAAFCALLGRIPFNKNTLEGRIQRQLILLRQGLDIPDPMRIFEEITRFRFLQGILPVENLYTPGELDALVAAYTAWVAATRPNEICMLGDAREGHIVIPVSELRRKYG
jgi:predicted RNase H-like nuclease